MTVFRRLRLTDVGERGIGRRQRRATAGPLPSTFLVALQQGTQAVVITATCRATVQVGVHSRHHGIGIRPGQLELDVGIERVEAFLATRLRASWADQTLHYAPGRT